MTENAILRKLKLKDGGRAAVLNAPESYKAVLGDMPSDVELADRLDGQFDFIHLFVTMKTEAESMAPDLRAAMKPNTILWISYPKGKAVPTDVNRDILWAALRPLGLETVSQVAIDEVWSAMRFKAV